MTESTPAGPRDMEGIIVRAAGGFYDVRVPEGEVVRCRMRGRLKRVKRKTDLCVVGDDVRIRVVERDDDVMATIEEIHPRRTVFSRQHPGRGGRHREDVLMANLDVLVAVFAYETPPFVPRMVDRFLVIAEHNGVDAIVLANKVDLRIEEEDYIDEALTLYRSLGYGALAVSATTGEGTDELKELLVGRIAAFAGPSGAGKSSLVNRIEPGLSLRTGATSEVHGKGRHTTRVATLHPLTDPRGGFVADTPGIRELAAWDIPSEDLGRCFPEVRQREGQCGFRSCRHLTEPGCAVLAAVESEDIDADRYESYARILLGEERPDRVG